MNYVVVSMHLSCMINWKAIVCTTMQKKPPSIPLFDIYVKQNLRDYYIPPHSGFNLSIIQELKTKLSHTLCFFMFICVYLVILCIFINWQPLCAGQYGKYGIFIGSEALTTDSIQTGIDIHSVTTMLEASYVNKKK